MPLSVLPVFSVSRSLSTVQQNALRALRVSIFSFPGNVVFCLPSKKRSTQRPLRLTEITEPHDAAFRVACVLCVPKPFNRSTECAPCPPCFNLFHSVFQSLAFRGTRILPSYDSIDKSPDAVFKRRYVEIDQQRELASRKP
jgi:hypothetical protein